MESMKVMRLMNVPQLAIVLGMGFFLAACGGEGGGEGPIVAPPQAPPEWADKHMPAAWWADPVKLEEGRKLYVGETNPDVNCGSCHGKDGKPTKAGARDFRVGDRMKLYSDSVWAWRIADGVPNTKMKGWKSKLSDDDVWKLVLFTRNFALAGKGWDVEKKTWVDAAGSSTAPVATPAPAAPAPADK
jgi:mono/diheme cytochrome c family protein